MYVCVCVCVRGPPGVGQPLVLLCCCVYMHACCRSPVHKHYNGVILCTLYMHLCNAAHTCMQCNTKELIYYAAKPSSSSYTQLASCIPEHSLAAYSGAIAQAQLGSYNYAGMQRSGSRNFRSDWDQSSTNVQLPEGHIQYFLICVLCVCVGGEGCQELLINITVGGCLKNITLIN